jgi:hypothetical protein
MMIRIERPQDATTGSTTLVNGDAISTIQIVKLLPMSGPITDASNAAPIVVTSAGHGLVTGDRVVVTGVKGNTAANGNWTITFVDLNRFSLNGSAGNGALVGDGATWTFAEDLYGLGIRIVGQSSVVVVAQMSPGNQLTLAALIQARDGIWSDIQAGKQAIVVKGSDLPIMKGP